MHYPALDNRLPGLLFCRWLFTDAIKPPGCISWSWGALIGLHGVPICYANMNSGVCSLQHIYTDQLYVVYISLQQSAAI